MSMIEKMALAMAEEFSAGRMKGRVLIDTDSCRRISYLQEEVFAAFAKAALSALEEPSEEMVHAGYLGLYENISYLSGDEPLGENVKDAWIKMIKAAQEPSE